MQATRAGWGKTLLAWQRTDALLFGPAVEEQIDYFIYFNPPKKKVITALLNATTPITAAAVAATGTGGQGLATLEYLLFDRELDDAQELSGFQGEAGQRRCAYLQAASELVQTHIHTITQAWLASDAPYARDFRQATAGNATFASVQQVIDVLIGKLYESAEKTVEKKTAPAAGIGLTVNSAEARALQNQANAYQLESWRSGYSIRSLRANMEGVQRILVAGGLLDWVKTHKEEEGRFVAEVMTTRLENYLALPLPDTDPFTLIQQGDSQALHGYYFVGKDIHRGIKRQLAKVVGAQLGFSANDGD